MAFLVWVMVSPYAKPATDSHYTNDISIQEFSQDIPIFPLLLTECTVVKSKGKISQNFVAFSEHMNLKKYNEFHFCRNTNHTYQKRAQSPDKMALEFSDYNIMSFRHFSYSKSIFSKQNSNIALIRNI